MTKHTIKTFFRQRTNFRMILPFAVLFIVTNGIYAQTTEPKKISESDEVFIIYNRMGEKMPEFVGGDAARIQYFNDNLVYPIELQNKSIQGRVIVNFIVEKDGSISSSQILRGMHPILDQVIIDLINGMPKWIPGELNNEIIRVKVTLPFLFNSQIEKSNNIINSDEIYTEVDKQPEFPGGDEARKKYLNENIRFPEQEGCGMPGRTIVRFIVEKDGSLTNLQVIRGLDPSLDKEAIRVVKNMPKWIPGEQNGEKVRVKFVLPIGFISSHYR